jgi:hypothetical protein
MLTATTFPERRLCGVLLASIFIGLFGPSQALRDVIRADIARLPNGSEIRSKGYRKVERTSDSCGTAYSGEAGRGKEFIVAPYPFG